jgi:ABC-type amino acid transport substrate-binding protein
MTMNKTRWIVIFVATLLVAVTLFGNGALSVAAQDGAEGQLDDSNDIVKVAIKLIDPFVMQDGDRFVGYSIDLWQELAVRRNLQFEYILKDDVDELIESVQSGEADIGIAAVSITAEREEIIDFSHSYFPSGLQIMTRQESRGLFSNMILAFLSPEFLRVMAGFILLIIIAAHVVWLFERHNNPHFPRGYAEGIFEALWWSVVTATTVGYGDKIPSRRLGRLIAIVWMFAGVFLVAYVTAVFSSTITLYELNTAITGPDDLYGKAVATVGGTTASDYLTRNSIPHKRVDEIEDAYALLEDGTIEAVVYDLPTLTYYAANEGKGKVQIVGLRFQREDYGLVMPQETIYREAVNLELLEMQQDGVYDELTGKWFSFFFE